MLFSATKTTGRLNALGHVQRLVEGALVGSAVAEEADDDPVGALELLRQRRAHGHGQVAADDAGGAQVAVFRVRDVHRAALALAVAGRLPHDLGHHLVVVFLLGLGALGVFVAVRVGVAVPAVRAGDQIVIAQRGNRADGHGLFTGVQVGRALEHALGQQARDAVFQRPDLHDLAQ